MNEEYTLPPEDAWCTWGEPEDWEDWKDHSATPQWIERIKAGLVSSYGTSGPGDTFCIYVDIHSAPFSEHQRVVLNALGYIIELSRGTFSPHSPVSLRRTVSAASDGVVSLPEGVEFVLAELEVVLKPTQQIFAIRAVPALHWNSCEKCRSHAATSLSDRADELAQRFENLDPDAAEEIPVEEYVLQRAIVSRMRSEQQIPDAVTSKPQASARTPDPETTEDTITRLRRWLEDDEFCENTNAQTLILEAIQEIEYLWTTGCLIAKTLSSQPPNVLFQGDRLNQALAEWEQALESWGDGFYL